VPDLTNSQAWNRYSYSYNNPSNYTDSSGHIPEGECGFGYGGCGIEEGFVKQEVFTGNGQNLWVQDDYKGTNSRELNETKELQKFKEIAKNYNIQLPPGNEWNYYDGWKPSFGGFNPTRNEYRFDGCPTGLPCHIFYDEYVWLSSNLNDYDDIEVASVMAEEARHAWQEYFIENGLMSIRNNIIDTDLEVAAILEVDANLIQQQFFENHGVTEGNGFYDYSMKAQLKDAKDKLKANGIPAMWLNGLSMPPLEKCTSWVCQ
jgi:hypothetical protein